MDIQQKTREEKIREIRQKYEDRLTLYYVEKDYQTIVQEWDLALSTLLSEETAELRTNLEKANSDNAELRKEIERLKLVEAGHERFLSALKRAWDHDNNPPSNDCFHLSENSNLP